MGNVYEAFSFNDATVTGKVIGDLTVDYCKTMAGVDVSQVGLTLTELGVGDYVLMNPNITERTVCRLYVTADTTKRAVVLFDPVDGNIATVTQILAGSVEGTLTLKGVLRILLAFAAGKTTGGATTAPKFRDNADAKNRISATVDTSGNRTAVALDADD